MDCEPSCFKTAVFENLLCVCFDCAVLVPPAGLHIGLMFGGGSQRHAVVDSSFSSGPLASCLDRDEVGDL